MRPCVYSDMPGLLKRVTTPTKPTPRGTEVTASEHFDVRAKFVALEKMGDKGTKGRLGRLIYEFETADVLNVNRRIYPQAVVAMAIAGLNGRCEKNQVFGGLDHPAPWDHNALLVTLDDAAIKVDSVEMVGETLARVTVDVMDNEKGRKIMAILAVEGNPGISHRAAVRWRDPTQQERLEYKIPDNTFVDVAEAMRLITYDIVSEPGFAGADGATVTEQATPGADEMKTPAELKAAHPALYDLMIAEGRALALGDADAKVKAANEAAATKHAAELKTVQEALAATQTNLKIATEALSGLKTAQKTLGIVNEQITDAHAAAKIATAEGEVKALTTRVATLEAEKKTLGDQVETGLKIGRVRTALEAVATQYQGSPAKNLILKRVARLGIEDTNKALEAARTELADLEAAGLVPRATPAGNPGGGGGGNPHMTTENLLNGLLDANPQNPAAGSGGGGYQVGTENALGAMALRGHSFAV